MIKTLEVLCIVMLVATSLFIGAALFSGCLKANEPPARKNLACVVAHELNLENPVYDELVTGWGFTPDTCMVQAATMQGTVRVPTQVVFCAVGTGVPECKMLFDLRQPPKKQ